MAILIVETIGGIADCVVVGVPTGSGTKAAAFVSRDPSFTGATADSEAVRVRCRRHPAPFNVPVPGHELEAFPIADGPNGVKVQRGELRSLAQDLLGD